MFLGCICRLRAAGSSPAQQTRQSGMEEAYIGPLTLLYCKQGFGSAFIFCESGSSCFSQCLYGSSWFLNADPDPVKFFLTKTPVPYAEFSRVEKNHKNIAQKYKKNMGLVQIYIIFKIKLLLPVLPIFLHFFSFFPRILSSWIRIRKGIEWGSRSRREINADPDPEPWL